MTKAIARKICGPTYDAVCLQGGCGYCNSGRWRKIDILEKEVKTKYPHLWNDFVWGKRHNFANADVKYSDGSTKQEHRESGD